MALNKYTQVEVAALSDAELSRLASVLRFGREITWDIWSPATDRNQSGELLERLPVDFQIRRASEWQRVTVFGERLITVDGITARSETIAAVCALLALEGRLA